MTIFTPAESASAAAITPTHNTPSISTLGDSQAHAAKRRFSGYEIRITSGPQHGVVMPRVVASCQVGGKGGKCTIENSVKISTTFTASAKIGVKEFEGSTGISIASEYSTTLKSTTPRDITSREMYVAYPAGDFYTYEWAHYTALIKDSSGKGTVFVPTGIQYKIIKQG